MKSFLTIGENILGDSPLPPRYLFYDLEVRKKCRIPSLTVIAEGISKNTFAFQGSFLGVSYLLWWPCCTDFLIVAIRNKERPCQEKQN